MLDYTFSVIVSTYYSKTLKHVLNKLEEQTLKDFEVIVTDDGSRDFKKAIKKERPYMIKYVWHPDVGRTWSWAHNEAIKLANGKYILFLHDDIIPDKNLLERLHKVFLGNDECIVAGVRHDIPRTKKAIANPEKYKTRMDYRLIVNELALANFKINVKYEDQVVNLSKYFGNSYNMVSGCILAMPTKELREIGGCPEDYPGYGWEDYDIAMRFKNNGFKIMMAFNAKGYHLTHKELRGHEVIINEDEFKEREKDPEYKENFNYKKHERITIKK